MEAAMITRGEVPVLREAEKGSTRRKLEGYAAVYNTWMERKWGAYTYREMDRGGLFDETLRGEPRVVLKFDHSGAYAATWNNTLELRSDDYGLHFTATVNTEDPVTKSMVVRMEDGLLREASVGFYVDTEEIVNRDDGEDRIITQGDLDRGDVSVCLYGMNSEAWSSIKRMLRSDVGRDVLRSLGYAEVTAETVEPAPAHVEELRQELVDTTAESEPGSDLWALHARLRLLGASG